jgi:hypothetical protein
MIKIAGVLGIIALVFAIIDIVHGQHTPGAARTFIHIVEFISFFPALCLSEVWVFRKTASEFSTNSWLVAIFFSLGTCILGFILFALSGGSFHGDGGPISLSFLALSTIGEIIFPISLVGFVVIAISRKRSGRPVLNR